MNSFLRATVVFHTNFLFSTNYMYACKSRFSVFSSDMLIYAILLYNQSELVLHHA